MRLQDIAPQYSEHSRPMKKITSTDTITFALSGTEVFVITPEGVITSDSAARIINERLGTNVTIIDMEPDPITVNDGVAEREIDPTPEPLPADVLAPSAPEETPAPEVAPAAPGSDEVPPEEPTAPTEETPAAPAAE